MARSDPDDGVMAGMRPLVVNGETTGLPDPPTIQLYPYVYPLPIFPSARCRYNILAASLVVPDIRGVTGQRCTQAVIKSNKKPEDSYDDPSRQRLLRSSRRATSCPPVVRHREQQGGVTLFTVALVGADGAGKTTVARALEEACPLPVKYLYMGVSPLSSNHALPTTRVITAVKRVLGRDADMAGPPDPTRVRRPPSNPAKRALYEGKRLLTLANKVAEEAYRQRIVTGYRRRGVIVVSDRDFFADYYAHDVANPDPNRSLASKLHGFILRRFYRRPDLIIFLDAPAELLYARKGEGSVALIEARRQEYSQLRDQVAQFETVDASQPYETVLRQVVQIITDRYTEQSGQKLSVQSQKPKDNVQSPLPEANS